MNFHDKLIGTAKFAKLCGVSKQTIIYYHNIELFYPHYIDEKGYRYYTLYQVEFFQVIKVLRDIGTPLTEIKKYLENRNPENYLGLLNHHKQEIKKQIDELQGIYNSISCETRKVELGSHILEDNKEAFLEFTQEKNIIVSNEVDPQNELLDLNKEVGRLEEVIVNERIGIYSINGIVARESLLSKKNDFSITNVYIEVPNKLNISTIKPKGRYASIYHHGPYEETGRSYTKLMKFIEDNSLTVKGNSYEELILGLSTQKNEDYLLKISILINN